MKKILLSLGSLLFIIPVSGQNNTIFYGGPGDGVSYSNHMPAIINDNAGGTGDGHATANRLQPIINDNAGGAGDGHSSLSRQQLVTTRNQGGPGDGHALLSRQQITTIRNQGGPGDGWNMNIHLQPTMNVNLGGAGDGWHYSKNIPFVSMPNKGGLGDGWAGTYHPLAPLPVNFLSFDAKKDRMVSRLAWKMGEDKEVLRFEVQRSDKAVVFSTIGEVLQSDAAGKEYDYVDSKPLVGHNYYRIKVWKTNGSYEYTTTRLVVFDTDALAKLNVYPNPATDKVFVDLPQHINTEHTVVNVYNVHGALVFHKKYAGQQLLEVTTSILAAGEYIIHVATDDYAAVAKFTVMK